MTLRILFQKLSDTRHALELRDSRGRFERVECETRSYLLHDLLHYAVEAEAKLDNGFWGLLADGKSLADMNDRSGASMADASAAIAHVEHVVGALTAAAKGASAPEVAAGLRRYGEAMNAPFPNWLTEHFIAAVQERLRKLTGRWRAIPYGGAMELSWPP